MIGCDCAVCRSSDPRDARTRPSVYLECDDGVRILVDTGPDLRFQALRHGIRQVDAVLYTHAHADHVMGLDEVRRFNVLSGQPMPVFGDARTLASLRRTFGYVFESDAPRGGGVPHLQLWTIGGPFAIGRQEIVPVPIRHGTALPHASRAEKSRRNRAVATMQVPASVTRTDPEPMCPPTSARAS